MNWLAYPGGELIGPGLEAFARGQVTDESLLVCIVLPRLRRHGLALDAAAIDPELANAALYERVAARAADGAHAAYNALIRRATRFCNALDVAAPAVPIP